MSARIRHSPLGAGLSLSELPILPFLAPRLLQAWPRSRRGQRAQSTASPNLESASTRTYDNNGQLRGITGASRQAASSGYRTCHAQSPQELSRDQSNGRRGTRIKNGVNSSQRGNRRPTSTHPESTRTYNLRKRSYSCEVATLNEDQSGHIYLQQGAHVDITAIKHNETPLLSRSNATESSSDIEKDTRPRYWQKAHVDILSDFINADREHKWENRKSSFGWHWNEWFDDIRNSNQMQRTGSPAEQGWRQVMQKVESIAHFDPRADINTLRFEWMQVPVEDQKTHWPGLMVDLLLMRPGDALKFLVATCTEPLPEIKYIEDCLDYIVEYHLYHQTDSPIASEDFAVLFGVVNDLLSQFKVLDLRISEYAIHQLLKHASGHQAETLSNTLRERDQKLSLNCELHFVIRLAKQGATDGAVAVLESMHRSKVDFTDLRVEKACATLLRSSQQNPEAVNSESDIFALYLKWGIRPNIIFYTILAHNAIESGDHGTAWEIYDMIIENDMEPSHNTYSIFLNDSKYRRHQEAIEFILDIVKSNSIRNEYIATDLLHAMLVMHDIHSRGLAGKEAKASYESLFQRMLLLYSTYFESAPLEDFAPEYFSAGGKPSPEVEGRRMHPDYPTLTVMMVAAIRCKADRHDLPLLYDRFKRLIETGHPDFVRVAKEANVFNALIKVMGQRPETLPFCTKILGDMLRSEAPAIQPGVSLAPGSEKKIMSSPTVQTWTMLVHSFMTQGQPRAAEKIIEMMNSRGTKPNEVTWRSLIHGYLQMRDQGGAIHALDRAMREGWTMDQAIIDRLDPSRYNKMLGQLPKAELKSEAEENDERDDVPSPPSKQLPEPREEPGDHDSQVSVATGDVNRFLRSSDFNIDTKKVYLLDIEAKRAKIEERVQYLLASGERSRTTSMLKQFREASDELKQLQIEVDDHLQKL